MLTGMLAVRNLVLGAHNDLWNVNTDQEYHEVIREKIDAGDLEEVLSDAFRKLDRFAFGTSLGLTVGLALCAATLTLVVKGGAVVGPHLASLAQYFPGYRVTVFGALVALVYGFVTGFVGGWTLACIRNAGVFFYMAMTRRQAERQLVRKLLEYF